MNKPLNLQGAADYLNMSPSTLRKKALNGEVPYFKPFGQLLFDEKELEVIIKKSRHSTKEELKHQAAQILSGIPSTIERLS